MLHSERHSDLYRSPDTVRIVKSRRLRWAGHVARMGNKVHVRKLVRKPLGNFSFEVGEGYEKITLRRTLGR
jgi:hypothetical protein